MKLAVCSGKGGTGKTTIAIALAEVMGAPCTLVDCDVEEPNCHLVLGGEFSEEHPVMIAAPKVDETRCTGCGLCAKFCRFHALVALGGLPLIFPELCHGCGGCIRVCPEKAMGERLRPIGSIGVLHSKKMAFIEGRLDVGEVAAPNVIRAAKERAKDNGSVVIDCPPGTACALVAAVQGCDFALIVAEPSPFGLHDMKLTAESLRDMKIPHAVLLNRCMGNEFNGVSTYCLEQSIPLFGKIDYDSEVYRKCGGGSTLLAAAPELKKVFINICSKIAEQVGGLK